MRGICIEGEGEKEGAGLGEQDGETQKAVLGEAGRNVHRQQDGGGAVDRKEGGEAETTVERQSLNPSH